MTGPQILEAAWPRPAPSRVTDLIQKKVEEVRRRRYAMLEGLAAEYLRATGLTPDQVQLVEKTDPRGYVVWYFEPKEKK